jgi:hypothetical protein
MEEPMFSRALYQKFSGLALSVFLLSIPASAGAARQWIGRVFSTSGVALAGSVVIREDGVFSGDLMTTSQGASALVRFSAFSQADIFELSSVRFELDPSGRPLAQISSGTLLATSRGREKNAVVVETAKYRVEPAGQTRVLYLVAVLADRSTVIEAQRGRISITALRSGRSYVLGQGRYALIAPSAFGVPGQQEEKNEQAPAKPAGQAAPPSAPPEKNQQAPGKQAAQASPPPSSPLPVKQPWHIGSLSHGTSIAVILAAGGGAAAAAAVVASSGGAPASPSSP